ncbi:peroxiredoxin [Rhizorhabdus dicambivorans]|uniref:thioredoxin-dependent peroxiredoxin n=1 Tax=Rhizorhabdus dicambivorans TaxID=1850238 RepID=A0A2A4FZI8_9SPHN|nr:peroxiredoxin [Rhizorhabdus dicambivorans]ATE66644.1 peroxiredoxin [Rhizorhabdus dicambivorans]PCE43872.1 peroxiredoxin [Rhizorhabdus dicambivorans]
MLKEGDKAPDVKLELPDGSSTSIAEQAGKIVVLYFYPKDDTPGCTTEAQSFTALADEFAAAGTTIIGVSKDNAARHRKFIDKYGLKVALASDNDGGVCEAYGTWIEKSLYGRQYMGIDRATFLIGKDGRIAKIWRKVKVKGHAEAVLAAAKAL